MRIAVTYKSGEVFQHFGHSTHFKLYDVENGEITGAHLVPVNGSGHSALASFLQMFKADVVICGGIGGGAKDALAAAGINVYGGVTGTTDDAIKEFLNGTLKFDNDSVCADHDHTHDCKEHECGSCCH